MTPQQKQQLDDAFDSMSPSSREVLLMFASNLARRDAAKKPKLRLVGGVSHVGSATPIVKFAGQL
jgi:hypothetical protein